MHASFFLITFAAAALASPVKPRDPVAVDYRWIPAKGTTATCDASSDKYISLTVGPEDSESVLEHACRALMPACAYPKPDMICTEALPILDGPKAVTLNATVESKETLNKMSGWAVNFTVTPPEDATNVVQWTRGDCHGYFDELLSKTAPNGCRIEGTGSGAGTIKVGGTESLKDTTFGIVFVERK